MNTPDRPASERSAEAIAAWPFPALLRGARAVYGAAIRQALDEEGDDDLPPNGPYVIAAVAGTSAPLGDVVRQLGVSKQTVGQLVDTLEMRGYLERSIDPEDRRRLVVRLTERGQAAAAVIRSVADVVEADTVSAVGTERVRAARAVLATMIHRGRADA